MGAVVGPASDLLTSTRHVITLETPFGTTERAVLFRLRRIATRPTASNDYGEWSFYCMESVCPHAGGPMELADVEDTGTDTLAICPWHQYDFSLSTGQGSFGLRACTFPVHVDQDGLVAVEYTGHVVNVSPVSEKFAPAATSDAELPEHLTEPCADTLVAQAGRILRTADPDRKASLTQRIYSRLEAGEFPELYGPTDGNVPDTPPRASRLQTVDPGRIRSRSTAASLRSRISMLHALANIEQWAIDLAWDILARFKDTRIAGQPLPREFFLDWARVANDEAKHFTLLRQRLQQLGSDFGAFPVHNGLWESAATTSKDLMGRICIIHLVHEARGLDVNPLTIEKFRKAGDVESVSALEIIHYDEITHVTCGHRWLTYICSALNLDPVEEFRASVRRYFRGPIKGPFNHDDRLKAGLDTTYYTNLAGEANG